jgi:hypothetical protein
LVDREGHRASTPAALLQGLDLGDTAQLYGGGAAEELVGEAIAGRRNQVFLASKILPESASRSGARLVCAQSLACLDTDRLDCCLLNWRLSVELAAITHSRKRLRVLTISGAPARFFRGMPAISTVLSERRVSDCRPGVRPPRLQSSAVCLQERAIEQTVLP